LRPRRTRAATRKAGTNEGPGPFRFTAPRLSFGRGSPRISSKEPPTDRTRTGLRGDQPGFALRGCALADATGPGCSGKTGSRSPALSDRCTTSLAGHCSSTWHHLATRVTPPPPLPASFSCPSLAVLVTSGAPTHLRWEHEIPILPLALPDAAETADLTRLFQTAAAAMFGRTRSGHSTGFCSDRR
jgi:hypothetical protein